MITNTAKWYLLIGSSQDFKCNRAQGKQYGPVFLFHVDNLYNPSHHQGQMNKTRASFFNSKFLSQMPSSTDQSGKTQQTNIVHGLLQQNVCVCMSACLCFLCVCFFPKKNEPSGIKR